jgi:hypothetical protein
MKLPDPVETFLCLIAYGICALVAVAVLATVVRFVSYSFAWALQ